MWLALLTWFDFDGCIMPSFRLKNKKDKKGGKVYEYIQVQFECEVRISETNPSLVKELKNLCSSLGLTASIKKRKKNWSGIEGIVFSKLDNIKEFVSHELMTGVKVSKKSKRFLGIPKQKICIAVKKILVVPRRVLFVFS